MGNRLRVHMRVPATAPLPRVLDLVAAIEEAGFDGAGVLDSQMISRDTFVTLGLAAARTRRLELFPAVTNPFTRHVSVLASAAATVEEMAPGRTRVVVGTGYTSASTIGRKPAALAEMRACVTALRALLAGERIDFDGTPGGLAYAPARRVPVLMAASAPRAIELAGEIADGALMLVGLHRGIVARALEHLERGARRGGRRLEDLEIVWAIRAGTAETTAEARRLARPVAVHWGVLGWGERWLEPAGLRIPPLAVPDAVRRIYPDLSHAHDWEAAIAATAFVPDEVVAEICDALGLVGTAEDCAARLAEAARDGVRAAYLMPFQSFAPPEPEIRAFRDVVFPRLAAAGLRDPA